MEFYDDEEYQGVLDEWEWAIVNDSKNYYNNLFPPFDKYELLNEWTYEMLLEFHKEKELTDSMWQEIEFCKDMRRIRDWK